MLKFFYSSDSALKMLYRAQLHLLLIILLATVVISAQQSPNAKPLSKSDVFAALERAKEESAALVRKTNSELITAITTRGVDFVLTPEEEWQLQMRDASDDLLKAIRDAVDPREREARLSVDRQQRLYNDFAAGYNSNDLASRRAALNAAREFVSLYPNDQNVAEIVTFMQRNLPRLEQTVSMMEQREAAMERARSEAIVRQQQMEQQRQERDRRRQETTQGSGTKDQPVPRDPNTAARRPETKEEAVAPRQPSDPVVRPRIPVARRP